MGLGPNRGALTVVGRPTLTGRPVARTSGVFLLVVAVGFPTDVGRL